MFVYWSMFAFPALFATVSGARGRVLNDLQRAGLALIFIAYVVLIGFRYEVGADWFAYQYITLLVSFETLSGSMALSDPAFAAVAWVSNQLGWGVQGPSFVCGLLLMIGVVRFCQRQADFWLALSAAVPYLLIVVGMGYVRQAAAIGLLLVAILNFERGSQVRAAIWLGLAGAFHVTALIVGPLFAVAALRRRPLLLLPTLLAGGGIFYVLLRQRIDNLIDNYSYHEYDSSGTLVRLLMNAVPALLFLLLRRRFVLDERARFLWLQIALLSLVLIPAVILSPSTTIVDRLGLYLIPIQLFVFGNLPSVVSFTTLGRLAVVWPTLIYYGSVLFVWLNFATHAAYWLPFRIFGLEIS